MKKSIKIGVIFYKNSYIKILKIKPINYDLKSKLEKDAILNSYKNFLKSCDFDFQILIQSKKENISKTISNINNITEENKKIIEIREKYIKYICEKNEDKKSSSKNYFIIIKKKIDFFQKGVEEISNEKEKANEYLNECYLKIKEFLPKCGNNIENVSEKEEIIEIFKSFIK